MCPVPVDPSWNGMFRSRESIPILLAIIHWQGSEYRPGPRIAVWSGNRTEEFESIHRLPSRRLWLTKKSTSDRCPPASSFLPLTLDYRSRNEWMGGIHPSMHSPRGSPSEKRRLGRVSRGRVTDWNHPESRALEYRGASRHCYVYSMLLSSQHPRPALRREVSLAPTRPFTAFQRGPAS